MTVSTEAELGSAGIWGLVIPPGSARCKDWTDVVSCKGDLVQPTEMGPKI